MSIHIFCPKCDRSCKVADHFLGKRVRCPQCSEIFKVEAIPLAELDDDLESGPPPTHEIKTKESKPAQPSPHRAENEKVSFPKQQSLLNLDDEPIIDSVLVPPKKETPIKPLIEPLDDDCLIASSDSPSDQKELRQTIVSAISPPDLLPTRHIERSQSSVEKEEQKGSTKPNSTPPPTAVETTPETFSFFDDNLYSTNEIASEGEVNSVFSFSDGSAFSTLAKKAKPAESAASKSDTKKPGSKPPVAPSAPPLPLDEPDELLENEDNTPFSFADGSAFSTPAKKVKPAESAVSKPDTKKPGSKPAVAPLAPPLPLDEPDEPLENEDNTPFSFADGSAFSTPVWRWLCWFRLLRFYFMSWWRS